MTLNQDFADLLKAANDHGVEYLVVGAIALAQHGMPRFTGDLDLFFRGTSDNAAALLEALRSAGFPTPFTVQDLLDPTAVCYIGTFPRRVYFLNAIDGVTFDEAWDSRVLTSLGGTNVPIIGLQALARNKAASGRPKDLADLDLMRRAGKLG